MELYQSSHKNHMEKSVFLKHLKNASPIRFIIEVDRDINDAKLYGKSNYELTLVSKTIP